MKKCLVGMVVLLSIAGLVNAAEQAAAPATQDMGITVDLSYTSKYIWRGYDVLDDVGAFQPSVNFDLGGGFSANLWMSYAGSSGTTSATDTSPAYAGASRVNLTEYDYTLAYENSVYEDCPWKTNYKVGWRYYDYIDTQTKGNDLQEGFIEMSFPALIGGGITPHCAYYQIWNAKETSANTLDGGAIFDLGFGYDFTLDQAPELPMTFTWDIVYNDGVYSNSAGGVPVDSDWSHMLWGLSTSMTCPATGGKITPAIYFQNSFEDTVNNEDELWAAISYSFSF